MAGMVWNWNMIITPLLLALACAMRFHAVYWPHSKFFSDNRNLVRYFIAQSMIVNFKLSESSIEISNNRRNEGEAGFYLTFFQITGLCVLIFLYGIVFATFPYYFPDFGYTFYPT